MTRTYRWTRLVSGAIALGVFAMTTTPAWSAQPRRAPNVLLILTDDQGYGDIRAHGNDKIDTPVLDRLAAQGARLDRFYVSAVCAPTRASLLTGRYALRTGVHGVTRNAETMRATEVTLAHLFRAAGYRTACFGKWHNGAHFPHHPNGRGFDEFVGFCGGHWNNYFDAMLERDGKPLPTKGYITDVLTDHALDFMGRARDKPFLCYVAFNAPHAPWQVPDKFFDKYKARGFDTITACAYGMCENIDVNIGRLLARLDELKLAEDTIVIFLTDNGPNTDRYNAGMRGRKASAHEGGVRVPCFIRWPGHIRPGTRIDTIAAHIDLLPTLTQWCGVTLPKSVAPDGRSLAPLFKEQAQGWPDDRMIFTHLGKELSKGGAVRTQRWRLVGKDEAWELFDMAADPGQKMNVAKANADVVKRLRDAFRASHQDVTRDGLGYLPIEIGHAGWPTVHLPGHEALLQLDSTRPPGISYNGKSGWANDWITNWTSAAAYPYWEIDVAQAGRYEITLHYASSAKEVGSRIRVEVGGQKIEGVIQKAHDPAPLPSHDRVPRTEVYDKIWAPLVLGAVDLPKGRTRLIVRALQIATTRAVDLKEVELRKVQR
jgi:arylsulfatase A-like enzyme